MSRLVEGNGAFFSVGDELVLLLEATDHTVNSIQEILLAHFASIPARGNQSRLIADVGNVCTTKTGRLSGQKIDVDAVVRLEGTQVDIKNLLSLLDVGHVHINLTVESTGPHQCAVQNVCPVGCRKDDDPTVGAKTIHFGEQLVECVFALIVGTHAGVLATGSAHCINFVDEHNARALVLRLLEKVPHPTGADPHEHLDKIRSAQGEEGNLGFARHRFGKQCFSSAWRSYKQRTLWDFRTQIRVLARVFQEFDNLTQFLFCAF